MAAGNPNANTFFGLINEVEDNKHGLNNSARRVTTARSLKIGSKEPANVRGGDGGARAAADNSASTYNGRGWIGRQDGLSHDDVAARRHKVW